MGPYAPESTVYAYCPGSGVTLPGQYQEVASLYGKYRDTIIIVDGGSFSTQARRLGGFGGFGRTALRLERSGWASRLGDASPYHLYVRLGLATCGHRTQS